ncbi:GntR family transcriptional regulator [Lactobacillus sp. PV037]|uniref:GntR family transcriptional regulator n=1 Tax=Lactobacillus sp. PV037 TaxID=2594496 RepID=UPI00223F758D|nr:GntR family transcriptional regulator [Lactobacillus sp. PV037]QNQ84190.1 GntR family transcriptional regulator [Lactobacillus sp. PV037]
MAIHKYLQVASIVEDRIKNKVYPPQAFLPDQEALAQELNVSRLTVKKAIDYLERLGYVYKRSGYGTVVLSEVPIERKNDHPINSFHDIDKTFGQENISTKLINFSIEFPNQEVQENLFIQDHDPVYNILRLRMFKNNPLLLEHLFIPLSIVPKINKEALSGSLYGYFTDALHLTLATSYRRIRACKTEENDITYLNAKRNDPILELEQIIWLSTGQPINYSTIRNKFDDVTYTILYNDNFN